MNFDHYWLTYFYNKPKKHPGEFGKTLFQTPCLSETTNQRRFSEPHPPGQGNMTTHCMKQWQKLSVTTPTILLHPFIQILTNCCKMIFEALEIIYCKVIAVFSLQSTRTLDNTLTVWHDITQTEDQNHLIRHFKLLFLCNNHCHLRMNCSDVSLNTGPFCCSYEQGSLGSWGEMPSAEKEVTLTDAELLYFHLNCHMTPALI